MNENTPTSIAPISTSAEVPEIPAVLENNSIAPLENSEVSPESIASLENSESNPLENHEPSQPTEPKPSYVKLAMRNMVRKRGKSLQHFFLTTLALLGVLVGLAYLTR